MSAPRPADEEDFAIFDSLRESQCPAGYFVGDGLRVVRQMLQHRAVERIICAEEWLHRLPPEVEGLDVRTAPRDRMDKLVGFRLHQGLMALGRIPPPKPPRGSFFVALDGLSNAENVGAILRTCAGFGVDGVFIPPTTASPWLRRAVRVSIAAPLHVPVHAVDDLPAAIRDRNAWAAHIHGSKVDYRKVDYRGPVCLVVGGEDKGVTDPVLAACRGVIYIPMAEGWDCLNAAGSAAVLMAEVRRQRDGV
jgi:tRNA G18 (ribose-2'-O)-methylase SpoU